MRPPEFWYGGPGSPWPGLLSPLAALYGAASRLNYRLATARRAPVPVICVGNLVAGGAGKTPVALALAQHCQAAGHSPHFISRGYGGSQDGLRVDPAIHGAVDVGDEALLLARIAPTWAGSDRHALALEATAGGADLVILDDGYQNPALIKDISIVVVDGGAGFGNGRLIPAGPLRELPALGLARAHAAVILGEDLSDADVAIAAEGPVGLPVFAARLQTADADTQRLSGKRVLAFAGIARPQKFFDTLSAIGADIADSLVFNDHHPYTGPEISDILERAKELNAVAVTTEKDHVRLGPDQARTIETIHVDIAWDDGPSFTGWLDGRIKAAAGGA
ncbi:MAG: tetraacyldisaccharide 4'-kinase [Rhodospirillaceae bacterium]|nr:tetraacyldisaccharide 4'-kinase [Rhodospirillaceae bacterium]